LKSWTTIGFFT